MTRAHTRLRPVEHTIVGTDVEIATALTTAQQQGRLVSYGTAEPFGQRGRYSVTAVLMDSVQVQPVQRPVGRPRVPRRYKVATAVTTAVLAVLAVVYVLLALLVQWIAANLPMIVGVLLVTAAVLLLARIALRSVGVCAGLHCEGCGHR